jgi:hypothetical protein
MESRFRDFGEAASEFVRMVSAEEASPTEGRRTR